MPRRRMISLDIVDSDSFAMMSQSAKYLYFELLIRADDDGFLGAPMRIARMVGCARSDLDELIHNGYIIVFETGIIVIRDWKIHNTIRKDMYKKTIYQDEFNMLCEIERRYHLKDNVTDNVTDNGTLSKDNISKDKLNKYNINTISPEPDESAPDPSGILLPLNDKTYYDVPLSDIALWKDTYPAVDIEGELKRMIAWLDGNPTKRKTRRGIKRFINSWLSRTQDRGGSTTRQQEEPLPEENNSYYDIIKEYRGLPKSPDDPWQ